MNPFETLAQSDNPVIALLATIVVALSGVVVYQWRYTTKYTVPKWIWDELMPQVKDMTKMIGEILFTIKK